MTEMIIGEKCLCKALPGGMNKQRQTVLVYGRDGLFGVFRRCSCTNMFIAGELEIEQSELHAL